MDWVGRKRSFLLSFLPDMGVERIERFPSVVVGAWRDPVGRLRVARGPLRFGCWQSDWLWCTHQSPRPIFSLFSLVDLSRLGLGLGLFFRFCQRYHLIDTESKRFLCVCVFDSVHIHTESIYLAKKERMAAFEMLYLLHIIWMLSIFHLNKIEDANGGNIDWHVEKDSRKNNANYYYGCLEEFERKWRSHLSWNSFCRDVFFLLLAVIHTRSLVTRGHFSIICSLFFSF